MFGLHMMNEMEKLHREMDQILFGLGMGTPQHRTAGHSELRVEPEGDGYRVQVALPGIDVESLQIDLLGRRLTLSAGAAEPDRDENVIWHRRERVGTSLKQALTLPDEIDSEKVEAEYRDGILTISLPKAASALPKKINVKA